MNLSHVFFAVEPVVTLYLGKADVVDQKGRGSEQGTFRAVHHY